MNAQSAASTSNASVLEMRQRLRWRARRGLLENDLLLTRYLDQNEIQMTDSEVWAFYQLLELPDNDLFDLLLQRKEPEGELDCETVQQLLHKLRIS